MTLEEAVGIVRPQNELILARAENEQLRKSNAELLAALRRLRNEVEVSCSLGEASIRVAIGNTNFACVVAALRDADAAIAKATGQA